MRKNDRELVSLVEKPLWLKVRVLSKAIVRIMPFITSSILSFLLSSPWVYATFPVAAVVTMFIQNTEKRSYVQVYYGVALGTTGKIVKAYFFGYS